MEGADTGLWQGATALPAITGRQRCPAPEWEETCRALTAINSKPVVCAEAGSLRLIYWYHQGEDSTRISVGLGDTDVTGKIPGENHLPVFHRVLTGMERIQGS